MSREEVVFTKKAIVVVSVLAVIGSNLLIGGTAVLWLWRFSDQVEMKTTEAATRAAITAVETTVLRHALEDTKALSKIEGRVEVLETKQEQMDRARSRK